MPNQLQADQHYEMLPEEFVLQSWYIDPSSVRDTISEGN